MNCREKMDKASAELSRTRSVLSMALKAGTEASRGELLDAIATALDNVNAADAALGDEETRVSKPGRCAPVDIGPQGRVVVLPSPLAASSLL